MKFGLFGPTSKESRETTGFGGAVGGFRSPAAKKVPAWINVCREYQGISRRDRSARDCHHHHPFHMRRRRRSPPQQTPDFAALILATGGQRTRTAGLKARPMAPRRAGLSRRIEKVSSSPSPASCEGGKPSALMRPVEGQGLRYQRRQSKRPRLPPFQNLGH